MKTFTIIPTFLMLLVAVFMQPAQATGACKKADTACKTLKRQQNMPALRGPKAPTRVPMRCISVINDVPTALVLREGKNNKGKKITSWRKATLKWRLGGGGWMTNICYPKKYDIKYPDKAICAIKGYYWFTREFSFRMNGAACVAGTKWCG